MEILYYIIVGAIAGWLGGLIMKGRGFGLLGNIVIGILGGFLGGFLFNALNISIGSGLVSAIVTSTIGAVVLLFAVGVIKKA